MAKFLTTLTQALVLLSFMDGLTQAQDMEEDEDHDQISLEQLNRIHSKCDDNGDGKASLSELMQFGESVRKRIAEKEIDSVMNEIDTSPRDGHATLQEYMDDLEKHHAPDDDPHIVNQNIEMRNLELEKFKVADADEDGALNRTELINMVSPGMHDKIFQISTSAELQQKDTDGDGVLSEEEFWGGHVDEEGTFQKLDKNGDGAIDLSEFQLWASGWYHTEAALRQLFDLADSDKDGLLTTAELESVYTTIDTTDAHYHLLQWANNEGEPAENSMVFDEIPSPIEEGEL
jgi:Ca2+-binding EF-hand superfamily protein